MAHSLVLPYDLVLNFARRGFPKVTMRPCKKCLPWRMRSGKNSCPRLMPRAVGMGRYGIGRGKVDRDFKHGDGSGMFLPPS